MTTLWVPFLAIYDAVYHEDNTFYKSQVFDGSGHDIHLFVSGKTDASHP